MGFLQVGHRLSMADKPAITFVEQASQKVAWPQGSNKKDFSRGHKHMLQVGPSPTPSVVLLSKVSLFLSCCGRRTDEGAGEGNFGNPSSVWKRSRDM